MPETVLNLGRTLTPEGILPGATVRIADGRIVELIPAAPSKNSLADLIAVPGFVDTHCHGAAGADFASNDPAGVSAAIEFHRTCGTTTLFASTVTESITDLVDQVGRLRPLVESGELAGIHLEGPFLALPMKGAHNPELLRAPLSELVAPLVEAGGGTVKMVTLAPELQNGIDATYQFVDGGVVVAFGHSDADGEQTAKAIDAGATVATHLFNAMRPIHHRAPGPVPKLLEDPRVMVELICDGFHLHPDVVRLAIASAGVNRVALVTDAMSATGLADCDVMLGTLAVEVRSGQARLVTADGSPGALAGSTLTMANAVKFVVEEAGCTIEEASAMASTTPASWHQLEGVGTLEEGKWADICFLDDSANLQGVMRRGEWVRAVDCE